MALSSKIGSFAANTITGNQAVTGVGFQPKAIIFFFNSATADGSSATLQRGFGMAISSSSRVAIAGYYRDNDAQGSAVHARRHDNTKCLSLTDGTPTVIFDADFVSMDADGFTVNITTALSAYIVNYIALGGSDLTNVAIKQWLSATVTGNQGITGVGFQPDCILNVTNISSTIPPASQTAAFFDIGFGISSVSRATIHETPQDGLTADDNRLQLTNAFVTAENGNALFFQADLVSLDSDGFTVNWTTANGTARYSYALCLKGGRFKIGSFNQATTTGNQATTGTGFTPTGLVLASFNNVSNSGIINGVSNSFGAGSSSSARGTYWDGAKFNVNPVITDKNIDRTKIIKMMTPAAAGAPTTDAAADLVSLDSNGFTLNWTIADATAREIIYFAFGSIVVSSTVDAIFFAGD